MEVCQKYSDHGFRLLHGVLQHLAGTGQCLPEAGRFLNFIVKCTPARFARVHFSFPGHCETGFARFARFARVQTVSIGICAASREQGCGGVSGWHRSYTGKDDTPCSRLRGLDVSPLPVKKGAWLQPGGEPCPKLQQPVYRYRVASAFSRIPHGKTCRKWWYSSPEYCLHACVACEACGMTGPEKLVKANLRRGNGGLWDVLI